MDRVECVVVGAGVVGLAVARELAMAGREVIVLEAGRQIGEATSSRNSGVIHAGIYYPTGSLKAELCVAGKQMLYDYCRAHDIPHRRTGKIIVATSDAQAARLDALLAQAAANGVADLRQLSASEMNALEPEIRSRAALLSPSTGIIDSHAFMLALRGDAEADGAMIAFNAPLESVEAGSGFILTVAGEAPFRLRADLLVNAAGLDAPAVARGIAGLDPALVPDAFLAKGTYFALSGVRPPFHHLIYPVPEAHGLGVHVTLDLAGQVRFGPDVEWIDRISYDVDSARAELFYASIRTYWPGLPEGALVPAYSGIRPKICGEGMAASDFVIQGPAAHGIEGLVNLFGIESPGLTASPAIARHVRKLLG